MKNLLIKIIYYSSIRFKNPNILISFFDLFLRMFFDFKFNKHFEFCLDNDKCACLKLTFYFYVLTFISVTEFNQICVLLLRYSILLFLLRFFFDNWLAVQYFWYGVNLRHSLIPCFIWNIIRLTLQYILFFVINLAQTSKKFWNRYITNFFAKNIIKNY